MIKQRLKRLASVVAAAAIAISALCVPVEAETKAYSYFVNLDTNGNILDSYNRDTANVDLTTPMYPFDFIKEGETNKMPSVYPWEGLLVSVWYGDSGGNGRYFGDLPLVDGKIAESTMAINTIDYGRYIQVSKTYMDWSMTIPCQDLSGASLGNVTISWDFNGDVSTGTFDFDSGEYCLYRDTGGSALFYAGYIYDANSLFDAIKGTYDAEDQDWATSYVLKDFSLKELNVTASPLTCGTKLSDIDFSYSTLPSFTGLSFSEKKVFDANDAELSDSVSLIGGATYKVCAEIERFNLNTAVLSSSTVIKINGENLTQTYDEQYSGSSGYYIGSGTLNTWYTFTVDHDITPQKGKPATCTEDGYKDHYKCAGCQKFFVYDDGGQLIEINGLTDPLVKLPALGHDTTLVHCSGHKNATCTENGYGDYYKCASCGQLFSDKDDRTATIGSSIDSALIIPATGHNAARHDAKPSTCTERGNIEYWQCDNKNCGKYFLTKADADNDNSTLWAYITLSPAHTYTNDQYPNGKYKSRDNTYHNRVCLKCDFADIEVDEPHTFNGDSCTKCGYEKPVVTTTSAAGTDPVTTTTNISTTTTTTAPTTATTTVPTTATTTVTTTAALTTTPPYHYYTGSRPYFTTTRAATTTTAVTTTTTAITTTTTTTAAATTTADDTSTPPDDKSKEPFLKGRNGLYGWSAIRDEIAKAKKGDKIYVDMNGTTKLPKDILEALEDKDVTLVLDMDDEFSWEINGKDVYEPRDLDLGVSKGAGISVKVINALTGECTYILITLEYDGEFGCKATLVADMGADNSGYWANLYWYVDDDEFEFITSGVIGKDGKVRLEFTHASEYAIVLDDHDHGANNAGEDDNPHTGAALSLGAVTIAAAAVIAAKKRRK